MTQVFGGAMPGLDGGVRFSLTTGIPVWFVVAQSLSDLIIGITFLAVSLTIFIMLFRARSTGLFDRGFWIVAGIVVLYSLVHVIHGVAELEPRLGTAFLVSQAVLVLVAVAGALGLPRMIPRLLSLIDAAKQSAARKRQLELANDALQRDIMERERIAAALTASEGRLRALITGAPLLLFSLDATGRVLSWDGQAADLLDVPGETVVGRSIFEVAAGLAEVLADVRQALAGVDNVVVRTIAGRPFEFRYVAQRAGDGSRGGVVGVATDVSERVRVEAELRQSQQDYQLIFDASPIGIALVDAHARTTRVNRAVAQIFKSSELELPGHSSLDFTHPDDLAESVRLFTELREGVRDQYQLEKRYFDAEGRLHWVHLTLSAVRDAEGNFLHSVSMMQDITARKQAEEALRASEANLAAAQEIAHVGSWEWDLTTGTIRFSDELYRIFGEDPAHFTPTLDGFLEVVHHADKARVTEAIAASFDADRELELAYRIALRDGTERTVHARGRVERDAIQGPVRAFGTIQDITDRERAEADLRASEERYRTILEQIDDGYFEADRRGNLLFFNGALCEMLGYSEDELRGMNVWQFMDQEHAGRVNTLLRGLYRSRRASRTIEWRYTGKAGRAGAAETSVTITRDRDGRPIGYRGVMRDITLRKEFEDRLAHQAFHDPLTGLANRALFLNRLEHVLVRSRSNQSINAVLFLDLDRFKVVNDDHGHAVGDELLRAVADRLRECVRAGDTVSRLGGDEFTILLEDLEDVQDAVRVAEDIIRLVTDPFRIDGRDIFVTTSIGIAASAGGETRGEDLLQEADSAMYRAKAHGKARYEVFESGVRVFAGERLAEEGELRRAIAADEFTPEYLPQVDLATGDVVGFEARLSWNHPVRGPLRAEQFAMTADGSGMIVPMGRWLIEQACLYAASLHRSWPGRAPCDVSIQLSPRQFHDPRLIDDLRQILGATGLDPSRLILTVDETTVLADSAEAIATLCNLKEFGAQCGLAGLGAGGTSLERLAELPIDWIVIDGSLAKNVGYGEEYNASVGAMRDVARALGVGILADGVETAEQVAGLRALGYDRAQGSYISAAWSMETFVPHAPAGIAVPTPRANEESVNAVAAG